MRRELAGAVFDPKRFPMAALAAVVGVFAFSIAGSGAASSVRYCGPVSAHGAILDARIVRGAPSCASTRSILAWWLGMPRSQSRGGWFCFDSLGSALLVHRQVVHCSRRRGKVFVAAYVPLPAHLPPLPGASPPHRGGILSSGPAGSIGQGTVAQTPSTLGFLIDPFARTASLNISDFQSPPLPSVGKLSVIWATRSENCTGTVVLRDFVLTAGHCLWKPLLGSKPLLIEFTPGMTYANLNSPIPAPPKFKTWFTGGYNSWVPQGYTRGDQGLDYGLVKFNPHPTDGRHLGDVTGSWAMRYGYTFTPGDLIYSVGYPADGFWKYANGWGNGQWRCVSSFDNTFWNPSNTTTSPSHKKFVETQCSMNEGASGAPWFVKYPPPPAQGQWYVGGIQKWCLPGPPLECRHPVASWVISPYLDVDFNVFVTGVLAKAATARAAASASDIPRDDGPTAASVSAPPR
jgi:Trypsin-like peptidase domain